MLRYSPIPPDDSVRTAAEVAAGLNHSSEYVLWTAEDASAESYARHLDDLHETRRRLEERRPISRDEYRALVARVAELEEVLLDLAQRFAPRNRT